MGQRRLLFTRGFHPLNQIPEMGNPLPGAVLARRSKNGSRLASGVDVYT
jgi:hypothetical protein